jgi:hypothetical protein
MEIGDSNKPQIVDIEIFISRSGPPPSSSMTRAIHRAAARHMTSRSSSMPGRIRAFSTSPPTRPPDFQLSASGFDPVSGTFPELAAYLSDAASMPGSDPHAEDGEAHALASDVDTSHNHEPHFGAGICSHCGGAGYTTYPSSGAKERCWYCDGSGVAS